MAKKSMIQTNLNRKKLIDNLALKRDALKKITMNKSLEFEERFEAQIKLSEMPRNSSKCRYRNRCALTGRPRGYHRKFGLSRLIFRKYAAKGMIPGITKSSW